MLQEIKVPDIGNYSQVEVIEVAVKSGDAIQAEDTLITLETEKASMDVPTPVAGKVIEMKVKLGDKVSQGDVIAIVEAESELKADEAAVASATPTTAPAAPQAAPQSAPAQAATNHAPQDMGNIHAGPATRQLARELGIDLSQVRGTGRKGRIISSDVIALVKASMGSGGGLAIEKAPEVDFSVFGEIEVTPLSRIKKWTAKNLHRNWVSIPHVTQFDEADITELEGFRQESKSKAEQQGVKLTPLPFIIKAVISALKAFPQFNASLAANGTDLVMKKYFHVGIAVDTPTGLMVPVIRNADTKGIFEIAKELIELSAKAKEGKLKNEEMAGSCFSISSLGSIGGTAFTPIINAPDVAILGISKAQTKPVYINNKLMPRLILPLSLSYDHRVIDGVEGAKFTTYLVQQLQDIRNILF